MKEEEGEEEEDDEEEDGRSRIEFNARFQWTTANGKSGVMRSRMEGNSSSQSSSQSSQSN